MTSKRTLRLALLALVVLVPLAIHEARFREGAKAAPTAHLRLSTVLKGFVAPTAVSFAPDGRIFVAEKQGFVVAYRSFADRRPRVIVDISRRVDSFVDRGLLSIALDPDFPLKPYLYLLYSLDAPPGGKPPVWHDGCPTPPGPLLDGCIGTGVLSRVRVSPSDKVGPEHVLIANRWCHQYTSHDIGDLAFGPGRTLYVSAGEGADWAALDWGQRGGRPGSPTPRNPCGDPPGGRGAALSRPSAQGGTLRAQDLMTAGDPVTYDGTVIRVDPDTGRALPSDPLYGGPVRSDDAVVAFGLRNPFRLAVTGRTVYITDPGSHFYDEIDRLQSGIANFGWPCYEGPKKQPDYAALGLSICNELYAGRRGYTHAPLVGPFLSYPGSNPPGTACDGPASTPSGLAVDSGHRYRGLRGGLFFSDFDRQCVFMMLPKHGRPNTKHVVTIARHVSAVDLKIGPGGDLYVVDIVHGTLLRLTRKR